MKLWFKLQTWVTLLAVYYVFFVFNDGYFGGLLLDAVFGFIKEGIKDIGKSIRDAIVNSVLQ